MDALSWGRWVPWASKTATFPLLWKLICCFFLPLAFVTTTPTPPHQQLIYKEPLTTSQAMTPIYIF